MKRAIRVWTKKIIVSGLLITVLLLVIILNPVLLYANNTIHNNFDVYHNRPLNENFFNELNKANQLIATSEYYNPKLQLDICLNDGSVYPQLIKQIRGQAFAWGFYNKVVLQGTANYLTDCVELGNYKWNFTQLLAHEMTHCLQFDKLGFRRSNPVANIPNWKWEGYAEYVARQNNEQRDLLKNIDRLDKTPETNWAVFFADSTIAPRDYYNAWILVQYCMNIKKMSYQQVLADTTNEQIVKQEMKSWYEQSK